MKTRSIAFVSIGLGVLLFGLGELRAQVPLGNDPRQQLNQCVDQMHGKEATLEAQRQQTDQFAALAASYKRQFDELQQQVATYVPTFEKKNPGKTIDLATGEIKDKPPAK